MNAPLDDLIENVTSDESPRDAHRRIDFDLNAAWELLIDHHDRAGVSEAMERTREHVDEAIATLRRFRRRLEARAGPELTPGDLPTVECAERAQPPATLTAPPGAVGVSGEVQPT